MTATQFPAWVAGNRLSVSKLTQMEPLIAYKASDQTVTSSTTLVDDNDLTAVLPGAGTYIFEGYLNVTGAANGSGDIKMTINYTGTWSTGTWGAVSLGTGGATTMNAFGNVIGSTQPFGANGANYTSNMFKGSIVVSTGGTLKLQWAQNTSSGTGTKVRQNSWMSVRQAA